MNRVLLSFIFLGTALPTTLYAIEPSSTARPGFSERLDRALGAEGGVQVYMDQDGNVGTIIDPPGGGRRMTVQPPQSPSMNVGPPLQIENRRVDFPSRHGPSHPGFSDRQ